MDARELFLLSDAALRSVIDRLTPSDLERAAPQDWTRAPDPTLRDILAAHARDEAWVPDLLAGLTVEQVGDRWQGDLLGDDPIGNYDAINDRATAAMSNPGLDQNATIHFSYGDYPFSEGVLHIVSYRAFQASQIARFVGLDFHLSTELIAGLNELLLPMVPELRAIGVFPPATEPPPGADAETVLLCAVGFAAAPVA
jgi:hypothetical protein